MADNTNDRAARRSTTTSPPTSARFRGVDERGLLPAHARAGCGQGTALYCRHPPPNLYHTCCTWAAQRHHQDTCIRRCAGERPLAGSWAPTTPASRRRPGGQEAGRSGYQPSGDRARGVHRGVLRLVQEYGTTIVNQIKGMGCSCDYDDEHFTLEPAYVKAVRKLFVDWYHDDHLQGQAHRQLVPALHHVHLGWLRPSTWTGTGPCGTCATR